MPYCILASQQQKGIQRLTGQDEHPWRDAPPSSLVALTWLYRVSEAPWSGFLHQTCRDKDGVATGGSGVLTSASVQVSQHHCCQLLTFRIRAGCGCAVPPGPDPLAPSPLPCLGCTCCCGPLRAAWHQCCCFGLSRKCLDLAVRRQQRHVPMEPQPGRAFGAASRRMWSRTSCRSIRSSCLG